MEEFLESVIKLEDKLNEFCSFKIDNQYKCNEYSENDDENYSNKKTNQLHQEIVSIINDITNLSHSLFEKLNNFEYESKCIAKEMDYYVNQNKSLIERNLHDSVHINDLKIEISTIQRDYDSEVKNLKTFYEEKISDLKSDKEKILNEIQYLESENINLKASLNKYEMKDIYNNELLTKFDSISNELREIVKENKILQQEIVKIKSKESNCDKKFSKIDDDENFFNFNLENNCNIDNNFGRSRCTSINKVDINLNKINFSSCETDTCTNNIERHKRNEPNIFTNNVSLNLIIQNYSFSILAFEEKEIDLNTNVYRINEFNKNLNKISKFSPFDIEKNSNKECFKFGDNSIPLEDLFNNEFFINNSNNFENNLFENEKLKDILKVDSFSNSQDNNHIQRNQNIQNTNSKKSVLVSNDILINNKQIKNSNNLDNLSDPLKDFFMLSFIAYKLNNMDVAELEEKYSILICPQKLYRIVIKINLPFHKFYQFIKDFYSYVKNKNEIEKRKIESSKKPTLIQSIFSIEELKNHSNFQNKKYYSDKKNDIDEFNQSSSNSIYNEYTNECVKQNYKSKVKMNMSDTNNSIDNNNKDKESGILSQSIKTTKNLFSKFFNI